MKSVITGALVALFFVSVTSVHATGFHKPKGPHASYRPSTSPTSSVAPSTTPSASPQATASAVPTEVPTVPHTDSSDGRSDGRKDSLGCQRPEDGCGKVAQQAGQSAQILPETGRNLLLGIVLGSIAVLIVGISLAKYAQREWEAIGGDENE